MSMNKHIDKLIYVAVSELTGTFEVEYAGNSIEQAKEALRRRIREVHDDDFYESDDYCINIADSYVVISEWLDGKELKYTHFKTYKSLSIIEREEK